MFKDHSPRLALTSMYMYGTWHTFSILPLKILGCNTAYYFCDLTNHPLRFSLEVAASQNREDSSMFYLKCIYDTNFQLNNFAAYYKEGVHKNTAATVAPLLLLQWYNYNNCLNFSCFKIVIISIQKDWLIFFFLLGWFCCLWGGTPCSSFAQIQ